MKYTANFSICSSCALESISEMKWSYFNVYFLTELRDLYIICTIYDIDGIPSLLSIYEKNDIKSENGKIWNKRNLLELTNALKKLGLISNNYTPLKGSIFSSTVGNPLTLSDKEAFSRIFFSYDRFKDFHDLFSTNGYVIAYKKGNCRFYNTFIVGNENQTEYYIQNTSSEVMRFWDVFLKWGAILGFYDRCLFKSVGLESNLVGSGISLIYRIQKMPDHFSVLEYATVEIGTQYISIIDLIWLIVKNKFFAINDIKERIVKECLTSNAYSLQSTSAIFIEEEEKRILPKIGNTYMSHLLRLN